jgi:hypothetical protein
VLPSHAGDGAVEATGPWCDVDAESCWRQLLSHVGDGDTESYW